jgi:hypothetical protein
MVASLSAFRRRVKIVAAIRGLKIDLIRFL